MSVMCCRSDEDDDEDERKDDCGYHTQTRSTDSDKHTHTHTHTTTVNLHTQALLWTIRNSLLSHGDVEHMDTAANQTLRGDAESTSLTVSVCGSSSSS